MGRYNWRPNVAAAIDYGNVDTDGSGTVLGDNNDGTQKKYFSDAGSILTFVLPAPSVIPLGREIIAVRVGHRQKNDLLLFNGWPRTYLRYEGRKQANTVAYKQDGYSGSAREVLGAALYNKNLQPWGWTEIENMGAETGAAVGDIGPNRKNRWCVVTEVFIQLVWNDPVPIPSQPHPANNQTIDTSSVQFSAVHPAPQDEQPVQTVFQVSRVNTFDDDDVRTFIGGLNGSVDPNSRSYYVSDPLRDNGSYTNLGPGTWYLRIKGRDFRGYESDWSETTSFNIVHGPLPTPSLTDPTNGSTINTPYRTRRARIDVQPSGGRRVGVTWQFSTEPDFSGNIVQWTNSEGGTFVASAGFPFDISYNPQPNPSITSGGKGGSVGVLDPSQYLAQGTWYARVRCTDVWDQSGAWSDPITFAVVHPPVPVNLIPNGGASFDQETAPVRWGFTDPWANDYQTSYRMRVYDASSNLIQDTGKTLSGVNRGIMSVNKVTHHRQMLTVAVDVWDADDVGSAPENQLVGTCRLSTAPIIVVLFPDDMEQIASGQPVFSWSCTYAAPGITQKSFRIRVTDMATGKLMYDSGEVFSVTEEHMPTRPILKNLAGYQLSLTVTDSEDLSRTVHRNFSTNFDRPEVVFADVDYSVYQENGYCDISWPTGNPDPFFKEWRVYRKRFGDTDDEYVLAGTVEDINTLTFRDWLIAGNDQFVYSVVQVAYRYGSPVESEHNPTLPFFIFSDSYWLIIPDNDQFNIKVNNVTGDRFTDNREMADINIIGGGRRRIYGTRYGKSGNLSIQVRHSQKMSATKFIEKLWNVCDENIAVYMRDPFGNVTLIAIGEPSLDRMAGVGESEFGDVDLPYMAVGSIEDSI
ncbi:minor tail protein [Gordonia phage GordTnk2]|uniref:Minor tail protein n=1 Tax=Gordonia phage GordTnk2 TaxID=1622192 RepID=A0A0E3XAR1_9CAUD|nr:minor tail protein [Gordonia phage GordTnk2]AKC02757.1 hypothetical protein GordTnk2_17 [Gordonia phage GordTnk2]